MAMETARKHKLGQKWVCFSCGAKFYDLSRPVPTCPKCQADQRSAPVAEPPKRGKSSAAPKPAKKPAVDMSALAVERPREPEEPQGEEEVVVAAEPPDLEMDDDLGDLEIEEMEIEGEVAEEAAEEEDSSSDSDDDD